MAFHFEEVLSELPRQVRVELDECLEGQPKLKSMQFELFEQLLDRDVIDVFTVKVDQACVDEEAFLESIVLDEHRHLFLLQTALP